MIIALFTPPCTLHYALEKIVAKNFFKLLFLKRIKMYKVIADSVKNEKLDGGGGVERPSPPACLELTVM